MKENAEERSCFRNEVDKKELCSIYASGGVGEKGVSSGKCGDILGYIDVSYFVGVVDSIVSGSIDMIRCCCDD